MLITIRIALSLWLSFFKFLMLTTLRHCYLLSTSLSWSSSSSPSPTSTPVINTSRPRQNGRNFPRDIFKCIYLNEIMWMSITIWLKFVPKGPINNIPALVQIMVWRRPGDIPLFEPIMVSLLLYLCVTRPQWVKKDMRLNSMGRQYFLFLLVSKSIHVFVSWVLWYIVCQVHRCMQYYCLRSYVILSYSYVRPWIH